MNGVAQGNQLHLGGQFVQGADLLNQAFQGFGPQGADTDHGSLSIHRVKHLGDQRGVLGRQEPIHPQACTGSRGERDSWLGDFKSEESVAGIDVMRLGQDCCMRNRRLRNGEGPGCVAGVYIERLGGSLCMGDRWLLNLECKRRVSSVSHVVLGNYRCVRNVRLTDSESEPDIASIDREDIGDERRKRDSRFR